jgi:hypothetical protein
MTEAADASNEGYLSPTLEQIASALRNDPDNLAKAVRNRFVLDLVERVLRLLGLITGFILAWHIVDDASHLVEHGHEWAGVVLGTLDVVGLIGVFVTGRYVEHRIQLRLRE